MSKETRDWLIAITFALFVTGLALFALIGGGYCGYVRIFQPNACTFGGVK